MEERVLLQGFRFRRLRLDALLGICGSGEIPVDSHDSYGSQAWEIVVIEVLPQLSPVLPYHRLLEQHHVGSILVHQRIHHRKVIILPEFHQSPHQGEIHRHHIVADEICVDAVAAEQSIHGSLACVGELSIDMEGTFWRC